ncbi:MAG TPA: S8 family serine peptidase [Tepidisphaeraceae bacterium]|nr:S8 family serine peptidase [Tepidisphaeraceae bacterium]
MVHHISRKTAARRYARLSSVCFEAVERRTLMASIAGAVFNDFNANGLREAAEPGLQGWTVFVDENNNGSFDGVQETRPSTDTPLPMPDDRTTRFSDLTVAGIGGTISDVNVLLNITHTFNGDLDIFLIGPDGTRVELTTDNGSSSDGMNVILDDEATQSVTTWPTTSGVLVTGSWRPEGLLSSFDGLTANGLWRLEWTDDAGSDAGTLNSWGLVFSSGEASTVSGADGSYTFQNLPAGTHVVRQINQAGFNQTAPAAGFHTIDLANAGSAATGINFGNRQPPGTIDGTVFGDYDGDGVRDPGEPGLAGWTVYVDLNNNGAFNAGEPSQISGANGSYSIESPPGDYKVRAVLQSGFEQTSPGADDGSGGWADGLDQGGNGFADDIVGRDFWTNDNNSNPSQASDDHGSHVAGIVAATADNGVGVAGTAPGVTVVPLRFYSTSGGTWTSTIVLNAYSYAAANNLKILTTSYNVDGFVSQQAFHDALNVMYDAGVLHFNSAGNNGALNPPRQRFDTTLYVANTQMNDVRNSGSNYGWGIDLAAPGTGILSTTLGANVSTFTYESFTGTSMSTPNAAAVAALIWSEHPDWTREQVAAALIASTDNINALQTSTVNGLLGSGRVNSNKALNQPIAPPKFKNTTQTPLLPGLPAEGATVASAPTSFTLDVANVFDPATMIASNFELRGDGADQQFGTTDDTIIPLTLGFGDASAPTHGYQIGTNRLFFTVNGAMAPDRYRFTASANLQDPFGQALDGNADGIGGDALTRTFIVGAARAGTTAPANNDKLNPGQTNELPDGVTISPTEVIARINDAAGLDALQAYLAANPNSPLAAMIDVAQSSELFKIHSESVVSIQLRAGANPEAAIAQLQGLALIQYAEPNLVYNFDPREYTPNDPQYGSQAHHPLMQNNLAWDTTLGDPRITVGVTDDGVAMGHPDLYQNIWINQAEIPATRLANLTDINNDGYISMAELNNPINIGVGKANDVNSDGRIDFADLLAPRGGSDGAINVTVVSGQSSLANLFGQKDIVAPTAAAPTFVFETAQRVQIGFSEDVAASLSGSDLVLTNTTTSQTLASADISVTYDANADVASFAYIPGGPAGVLPDGNYTVSLPAGTTADPYGNATAGAAAGSFFVLAGDATRDRNVNLDDFTALSASFGLTGTVFSQGNFNYDNSTDLNDFTILATQFGKSLPQPRPVQSTSEAVATGPVRAPGVFSQVSLQPLNRDDLLAKEKSDVTI